MPLLGVYIHMMTIEPVHITDSATSPRGRLSFPDERQIGLDLNTERRIGAAELNEPWYYPSGLSPIAELAWELGLVDSD